MKLNIKHTVYLLLTTLVIASSACKKPEGEGGNGRIKGSVKTEKWNSTFTVKEAEWAAMDEWVYIVYGNNISYSDRIRTNFNGEYEFRYLRTGNYKIYVYSDDKTLQSPSGTVAVVKEVKVTDGKTTEVEQITIYK